MEDNKNKSSSLSAFIFTFLKNLFISIGIFSMILFLYILPSIFINAWDGGWNTTVFVWSVIFLPVALILPVWIPKKVKKAFIIIAGIAIFLTIANIIYYDYLGTRIETKIYLHNKYNYNYSEMKIIKAIKYDSGDLLGHGGHNRSAIIKYQEKEIIVYYDHGWNAEDYIEEEYDY